MKFELLPVIDQMLDLYHKPRSIERFKEYLALLQGNTKGDLSMPLGGFNPMGKEHVVNKLHELKAIDAEKIIQDTLLKINSRFNNEAAAVIKVALNLSDDLHGGWTNRYTTDYQSKFTIQALVTRHFCVPLFWTGEVYTQELIAQRTMEYACRTIWVMTNGKPRTLEDHVAQESFVAQNTGARAATNDMTAVNEFYETYRQSEDYSKIFCFMYGDKAASSLGYPVYGISEANAGFLFAGKHGS